jgi:hypothetical protein
MAPLALLIAVFNHPWVGFNPGAANEKADEREQAEHTPPATGKSKAPCASHRVAGHNSVATEDTATNQGRPFDVSRASASRRFRMGLGEARRANGERRSAAASCLLEARFERECSRNRGSPRGRPIHWQNGFIMARAGAIDSRSIRSCGTPQNPKLGIDRRPRAASAALRRGSL